MIPVTNLRAGVVYQDHGDILQILKYDHVKMGRGTANVVVKIKNLKTGAVLEKSFISGAKVQDAELSKKKAQFLYSDKKDCYFMDNKTFEQFTIPANQIEDESKFLKENEEVVILFYEDTPLLLDLPKNLDYKVIETDPGVRGDSVSNIWKRAVLENGLAVKVPLFVKAGDMVKVDTRTQEYVERVSK